MPFPDTDRRRLLEELRALDRAGFGAWRLVQKSPAAVEGELATAAGVRRYRLMWPPDFPLRPPSVWELARDADDCVDYQGTGHAFADRSVCLFRHGGDGSWSPDDTAVTALRRLRAFIEADDRKAFPRVDRLPLPIRRIRFSISPRLIAAMRSNTAAVWVILVVLKCRSLLMPFVASIQTPKWTRLKRRCRSTRQSGKAIQCPGCELYWRRRFDDEGQGEAAYREPAIPGLGLDVGEVAMITARHCLQTLAMQLDEGIDYPPAHGDHILWSARGGWAVDGPLQTRFERFPRRADCPVCGSAVSAPLNAEELQELRALTSDERVGTQRE